ncbi:MAG: hypothetical protein IJS01_05455 [Lentisphaeria bacterium]|nr:hypothetical protein [Lentisphaeria bacterium]
MADISKRPQASSSKSAPDMPVSQKEVPATPAPQKLAKLEKYEAQIKEGIIKYYEMGALLQTIRDEKLYELRECKTFAEYCRKVFNFGRAYGYRLIAYCRVWNLVRENADDKVPEHVIRALYSLKSDEAIKQCWDEAKKQAGDVLPTYDTIEALVKERRQLELMSSKQFDPQKETDKIFLCSIRSSVSKKNVAAGIVEASGKSFRKIYNSIKEAQKRGIEFSDNDQATLRDALINSLESVFKKDDTGK